MDLTDNQITQLQELLAIHRRTLAHLTVQAAYYGGEVFVPPHIAAGLHEARNNIRKIKDTLLVAGINILPEPNEDPVISPDLPPVTHPPSFINNGVIGVLGVNHGTVIVNPSPNIPSPPMPADRIVTSDFVGRITELDYFAEQLASKHLVVISGMPGVGKTALGIALANQVAQAEKTFWHSFHLGEGIDGVIWRIAGFLAQQGQDQLWRLLNGSRQSGGPPPPPTTLIDYLIQLLRGRGYLIVLDDLHHVDDDSQLEAFMRRLLGPLHTGELSLIVMSRHIPYFAQLHQFRPLTGLVRDDIDKLLTLRGLHLSADLITELQNITNGNAQFLILAIDSLRDATDPASIIRKLAGTDNIERYLLKEIDSRLTQHERDVMGAVAALLDYPGTRAAIEALLGEGNIKRALARLVERHLLSMQTRQTSYEYSQHAIVREFYYDLLEDRQRCAMHLRAGRFYNNKERDTLRAARHFERASEHNQAAELITTELFSLINQGQSRALRQLLDTLAHADLTPILQVRVELARGQLYMFLGHAELARTAFDDALKRLATLPAEPILEAGAYRGIGDLLKQTDPRSALTWYGRGLDLITGAHPYEEAALRIGIAMAQMRLGDLTSALAMCEQGLTLLPNDASQLRSTALVNMGGMYFSMGNINSAIECVQQAIAISQALHDQFQVAYALINLGVFKFTSGNWREAIKDWEFALSLAEEIGSVQITPQLEANLGVAYSYLGNEFAEEWHMTRALEIAGQIGQQSTKVNALIGLAGLRTRQGTFSEATSLLEEAEALADQFEDPDLYVTIWYTRAELHLAQQSVAEALIEAERAVNAAREDLVGSPTLGISLRVLGQVQAAVGRMNEALIMFEQSLALVDEQDQYEAAQTRMHWGYTLLAIDPLRGQSLLRQAKEAFEELGALHLANRISA